MRGHGRRWIGQAGIRLFRPPGLTEPAPALLWIHGGGYVIGSAQQDDRVCHGFSTRLGITVASVETASGKTETRTVLRLDPRLAPIKAAVLPLSKNETLVPVSDEVAAMLRPHWMIDVDLAGSIGKRYRRQDEVGTPLCVTVDFDTIEDRAVTVRERDSMAQERIPIDRLVTYLTERLPR